MNDPLPPSAPHEDEVSPAPGSAWGWLGLGHRLWRFPLVVAGGWAVVVAVLGSAARLLADGPDEPSRGEVLAASAFNFAWLFVLALVAALAARAIARRRVAGGSAPDEGAASVDESSDDAAARQHAGGRAVVPTTIEGRVAVGAALLGVVVAPALFAAPVLVVLAWRRGDRGLLLLLPVLTTVLLVAFVVAELTIGHD